MQRWPLNKAYFWETAPFFRIVLPFAAGIFCYDKEWLSIPGTYALLGICAAFILYLITIVTKRGSSFLLFSLLCVILFFAGSAVSYFNDVRNDKTWFGNNINSHSVYLARITDAPSEKENSWKVTVHIENIIDGGKVMPASGNAFLYLYKDRFPMLLHKGDSILVPGNWQPIRNAGNPYEFDYTAYCRRNDLYYQQNCAGNAIRLYAANDPAAATFIDKCHDWCMQQLEQYIPDAKTKGLIQAMLLGDEVNLDEELRQSYSETGIVHIIAISGGNVAIFFFVISWLLWWLRHKKHLWVKYAVALPLVWVYVIMAGAAPSAIRAAIMFSLLAFSIMFQKNSNSLNQLFATAFLLLFAQPMWLFSLGFQLSFVAVLSIILFYKRVYRLVAPVGFIAKELWSVVAASIAAEVLVAPLVIYYFHNFPLLFIVANVVAYLFMSFVLILGIAIIVLSPAPPVASFIGKCTVGIVTFFDKFIVWLQSLNPPSFHFLMFTGGELLMMYIAIAGLLVFLVKKQKAALFISLAGGCLLLISFCRAEYVNQRQQRLVVYNTGKANHIELIKGNRYTVLSTDSAAGKKIAYATKPAHIAWQAWQQDTATASEVITMRGKTILILNRDIDTSTHFPVDYLIINCLNETDPEHLMKIFSPGEIVIGNNYSQQEQYKFIHYCMNSGISVHSIAFDGAFVVE